MISMVLQETPIRSMGSMKHRDARDLNVPNLTDICHIICFFGMQNTSFHHISRFADKYHAALHFMYAARTISSTWLFAAFHPISLCADSLQLLYRESYELFNGLILKMFCVVCATEVHSCQWEIDCMPFRCSMAVLPLRWSTWSASQPFV